MFWFFNSTIYPGATIWACVTSVHGDFVLILLQLLWLLWLLIAVVVLVE